jgi:hypothetical protein
MTKQYYISEVTETESSHEILRGEFNDLRTKIVASSNTITEKSGEDMITEKFSTELLTKVNDFETNLMSLQDLYKPLFKSDTSNIVDIKVFSLLNKYKKHIIAAISNFEDEIDRENEMAQFSRFFYEMDYIKCDSENFFDIINSLRVAIISKVEPYSLDELVCLRVTFDDLMRNFNITDKKFNDIMDKIERHFNTIGPLSKINHNI